MCTANVHRPCTFSLSIVSTANHVRRRVVCAMLNFTDYVQIDYVGCVDCPCIVHVHVITLLQDNLIRIEYTIGFYIMHHTFYHTVCIRKHKEFYMLLPFFYK